MPACLVFVVGMWATSITSTWSFFTVYRRMKCWLNNARVQAASSLPISTLLPASGLALGASGTSTEFVLKHRMFMRSVTIEATKVFDQTYGNTYDGFVGSTIAAIDLIKSGMVVYDRFVDTLLLQFLVMSVHVTWFKKAWPCNTVHTPDSARMYQYVGC